MLKKPFKKSKHKVRLGSAQIVWSKVPWDSKYLSNTTIEIDSIKCTTSVDFQILLARVENACKLQNGDLVVCKIPLSDKTTKNMLQHAGFYWVEQSITITINLSDWNPDNFWFPQDDGFKLIQATRSDKTTIKHIAKNTFTADRFHMDQNIPKAKSDYRFEKWIDNSFKGTDTVYKFINKTSQIIGFFIINKQNKTSELRLAGLDPAHIGKGVGKILYHHMYELLKKEGVQSTQAIISLNNLPVLNIYIYLGSAKVIFPLITFHKTY